MIELANVYPAEGFYELTASVQWEDMSEGHRFFHVRHGDNSPPTISEAIDASVLHNVSRGKQMLRGHVQLYFPMRLILEVWSSVECYVELGEIEARLLDR